MTGFGFPTSAAYRCGGPTSATPALCAWTHAHGGPAGPRSPGREKGKNRVHVDLASKDPEAEITRLVELGASRVQYREGGLGNSWTVTLDPEGNEFCIA